MDNAQDLSQEDGHAGEVMESIGETQDAAHDADAESQKQPEKRMSPFELEVKKRLKQKDREHEREIRDLHAKLDSMHSQMSNTKPSQAPSIPYDSQSNTGMGIDEHIQKAVTFALNHREVEEAKAKNAQQMQHVQRQYEGLNKHLDDMSDKYDDFDDAVRGEHVPITNHMRDASLMLPKTGPGSAGEVLYKLGKNPDELSRISKLHPLDQASEMVKLSHALISGGESKASSPRPLGTVKANPVVNSPGVTDKTPVSSIRERMRNGNWK